MNLSPLFQIGTFIVFAAILYRYIQRPVGKILRQRSDRIETSLRTAEENIRRAQELQRETEEQLARARAEAQSILAAAHKSAEAQREALIEQARRDADSLVRRAQSAIERERQVAVDELRREAARAAVFAAGRVLDRSLDADTNRELAGRTIAEVGRMN